MAKPGFRAELPESIVYAYGKGGGLLQLAVLIELSRTFSYEQVSKAVAGLVSSFPILACRYLPGPWRDRWMPVPDYPLEKVVSVEDCGEDLEARENRHVSAFLDVENGWPFRVAVLNHSRGSRMIIIYPHLLGDANAGLTLTWALGKWLYGPGLPPAVPMDRGLMQLWRALGVKSIPTLLGELLREAGKIFYLPFLGRADLGFAQTKDLSGKMNYIKLDLKGPAYQKFSELCKKNSATINDGLAAISALTAFSRAKSRFSGTLYTINGRRYLTNPGPILANFSGVNTLALSRKLTTDVDRLISAVARRTGEHKSRLPGLAFSILPLMFFFWMPSGGIHWFARNFFGKLTVGQAKKFAAFTNVGNMDPYLEPFGADALEAWMLGAFQRGFGVPLVMASGFRESLAVCVCAADDITRESVENLAADWQKILSTFPTTKQG